MNSFLLLIFLLTRLFVFCFELNEKTAFLLNCPINKESDFTFINSLISTGYPIDIFQENIVLNKDSTIQLLTDKSTSEILLNRTECFQDKSRSSVTKLFTLPTPSDPKFGQEFHENYRSYENILLQLEQYAKSFPSIVKILKSIGKSHEGRELPVIHLTSQSNRLGSKPLIWIMAGQHAREWIAPATAMFFIDQLLKNQKILNDYEFAIMPLVNPDGYEYSRSTNRMWRKNRRPKYGVDLNRNWNYHWCEIGASNREDSQIYCGPAPASEPEVKATQNYILSLPNRVIGFDLHSYSQLILRSYGWTKEPAPHESTLLKISETMTAAIQSINNQEYEIMPSVEIYLHSGTCQDWMYAKADIFGFTIELRDRGYYKFDLPPDQIKPTGLEIFAAIMAALNSDDIPKFTTFQ